MLNLTRNTRCFLTFISALVYLDLVFYLASSAPKLVIILVLILSFVLFRYVAFNCIDLEDGFCFESELGFTGLQPYPSVGVLRSYLLDRGICMRFSRSRPGVWHPDVGGVLLDEVDDEDVVGSSWSLPEGYKGLESYARQISRDTAHDAHLIPTYNQARSGLSRLINPIQLERPHLPSVGLPKGPTARRRVVGDESNAIGSGMKQPMDQLSAMESAKVLSSGMDVLGTTEERVKAALGVFTHGVPTAVAPSAPAYAKLVEMLGPLRYSPRIEAHKAAATIRRAALDHAANVLQGAIVGLISPSKAEMHSFPRAAIWLYDDELDGSRRAKHCSRCKSPECEVLRGARLGGRVYDGQSWQQAAAHFRRCAVTSLLLLNIEPSINAEDLTRLMVAAGVGNGYSLSTIDWRVLLGRKVHDSLIDMTTEISFGKVISSFEDGGDYVQNVTNVKQMFAPTYAAGRSLRRTVVFGNHASQYYELSLSRGYATRCLPGHGIYYFVKVIMPDLTRPMILVEKRGMDRMLATYRTQAIKSPANAMIVLRQSVVTYSISGTQVTPRVALTASEAEALACWIVVYSEVQDAMAEKHMGALRAGSQLEAAKSAVFGAVTSRLRNAQPVAMAMGVASSVDAVLQAYRKDIGTMTLDQASEKAMEEVYGTKIDPAALQNTFISAWRSLAGWVVDPKKWLDPLSRNFRDTWCIAFSYVDLAAVMGLLGLRFSIDTMRVTLDCVLVVSRMTGKPDATRVVKAFLDRLNWQQVKYQKFWISAQDAQALDFQAACIDIVETFYELFAVDHAAEIQTAMESDLIDAATAAELQLNDALPYSDFMSEVKLFLGKFNSHARRLSATAVLLTAFHHDCRSVSGEQKARMIHMLRDEVRAAPVEVREEMGFAIRGKPETKPLPLRPIAGIDIRDAFAAGVLRVPGDDGAYNINLLNSTDGVYDFGPIHRLMDLQHGETVDPEHIRGPNYISPDERGARIQFALIQAVSAMEGGVEICPEAAMQQWYEAQNGQNNIQYVNDVLRRSEGLFTCTSTKKWIAHVTGLAMGGKSKGIRSWITSNDLVVVPTRELKREWQENLGLLDPTMRASVVTQHEALEVKYAARYVIVDECYAFDPEHLQAIMNRQSRSAGMVTVGDRRQIGNVFSPTGNPLIITACPCVMITPTTFVGWDAAVIYLTTTVTDTYVENLFVGTKNCESLRYTLEAKETLLPGVGDVCMQGTQVGKEVVKMRGPECNTVHECQGRRTTNTILHFVGTALVGDLRWLGAPEQNAHMGVAITRARESTVMVVDSLAAFASVAWYDERAVNGVLSDTLMLCGTSWDLVEPRTESESTWEHIVERPIVESCLVESALSDPVTIATVFTPSGEPLSTSEIRTNVELCAGVTFRDEGIPCDDTFDNYTSQPRDHPGADQSQAMTRAVPNVAPCARDFEDAERIVEWLFEEVIDKKKFFAHIANSRRAALKRQSRDQVLDGCYANVETAASCLSFAFLKPEFAKKPSVMEDGPCELKAQGVISASDMQQAIFADCCDALTHAWARSMQKGKLSPVGYHEAEVEGFLATFDQSYELDIEKQDSSHKPVHIIVASIFLQMAADKYGLGAMAMEIRSERKVRMMKDPFKFVLNMSLASGDPWTLIINKIMAFSSLISVAKLAGVRVCQSGDDVTMDREPEWRLRSIRDATMANKGLTWKVEERRQRENGVTFISRAVLPGGTVVYKALRTVLKYAYRKRNSIQHAGIAADVKRIEAISARHGLQAYAEARALVWGGDPVVIFDMWTRAIAVAKAPFDQLPDDLKVEEPRQFTVRERDGGCFGFALANCVAGNVQAINAIASYRGPVTTGEAIRACADNGVPSMVMDEVWAKRSKGRLVAAMDRENIRRSFVVIYRDHAVAVVPNTIIVHGAFGKRTVTWKESMSKDVIITDFD